VSEKSQITPEAVNLNGRFPAQQLATDNGKEGRETAVTGREWNSSLRA
jgi:hypothetical protein